MSAWPPPSARPTRWRFGGDEFVVLCEGLAGAGAARQVADRLIEAAARPVHHDAGTARLAASVGVVLVGGAQGPAELIEAADRAMYRAKRRGGANVEITALGLTVA